MNRRSSSVVVLVPGPLRETCSGAAQLTLEASSVRQVLSTLERQQPALYRSICDETGSVRRHVNLFINSDHMRDRQGLETSLVPGDEIIIMPAVSGG